MPPKKIGRYIIKDELGRGGMATVYRAYDPSFEREVAIKVLPRELLHDEQFRGRFEREAKIIARLEHAAIVPVYDVGEEKGQPFFVMRYMTGGSLSDKMKSGPMPLTETARIFQRLASALDYAHTKGIVHRDLKPGNILFDEAGDPYISDFGIAKLAQAQTTNLTGSSIIGTPTYMSPEQAQGEDIDGRSDIYSLGVILYEMLGGRPPYESNTPLGLAFKHVSEPVPHILDTNPGLPVTTEQVIETAMAKSKDDRFDNAADLAEAVSAISKGESPSLTRKVTPPASIANTPAARATRADKTGLAGIFRQNPIVFIVGGLIVIALLVLAGSRFMTPTSQAIAGTPTANTASTSASGGGNATTDVTTSSAASLGGVGGADKIAMISGNNIWVTDIDGSNPVQLTRDAKPKFDLQWLPDGQTLAYGSGLCAYTVDLQKNSRQVTCFSLAKYFEGFEVSPDGKQVALNVDRQLYVIPYDLTSLSNVHSVQNLATVKGCLAYTVVASKNTLWSSDGKKLAVLFAQQGSSLADTIRVIDIHDCGQSDPLVIDEFPGKRFSPDGYIQTPILPAFSWDGAQRFLFNTFVRNQGFGLLYTYDMSTTTATKIDPIGGTCCYRDAHWSPDGKYIIFAFQDISKGEGGQIQVYYIPFSDINSGGPFTPLKLSPGFFAGQKEVPQFALRPAKP